MILKILSLFVISICFWNSSSLADNQNKDPQMHPFPVTSDEEDLQSAIIEDIENRNNVRGSRIGDNFVSYDDMYNFLDTIPNGNDKMITRKAAKNYNDVILSAKENELEAEISMMNRYYAMHNRILAPTMKE